MNKRVLIIDDEVDLCEIIRIVFIKDNISVDCAHTLEAAGIKLLQHPEIVFLDNYLPDGTGLDMLERQPFLLNNHIFIMMTADANLSTQKRAATVGIPHFILKPFSLLIIRELVGKIV